MRKSLPALAILSVLLGFALVLSAGCGGSGTSTEKATENRNPTTENQTTENRNQTTENQTTETKPGETSSPGTSNSTSSSGDVTETQVGVPVYPGTTPREAYKDVYKMITTDGYDKVVGFYKEKLPEATFSEMSIGTGKGAAFNVQSADFHGNVSVEEGMPAKGQVTITVSKIR